MQIENVEIPDYVEGFLCAPALLEGEDPGLYWKMFAGMIEERKPQTVSDWIALNDLATKLWEERICRRAANAIIRGGKLFAVRQLMDEIMPGETKLKRPGDTSAHRANRYFSDKEEERNEIRSALAKFGITEVEVHAMAAQYNSDSLMMFERMIASRERSRRKLHKEDRARRSRSDSEPANLGK